MGIYIIQSKIKPERIYVGSGKSVYNRRATHLSLLRRNKHHSKKLQLHYDKYGEDDLIFEVIESGEYFNHQHLLSREQGWYWHFKYRDTELPYFNITPIAGSPMEGRHHSDETKEKFKKRVVSAETRKKMSDSQKRIGNHPPSQKGKKQSPEHAWKRTRASVGNKVWEGRHHKQSSKDKTSKALKGKKNALGYKWPKEKSMARSEIRRKSVVLKKLLKILDSLMLSKETQNE